ALIPDFSIEASCRSGLTRLLNRKLEIQNRKSALVSPSPAPTGADLTVRRARSGLEPGRRGQVLELSRNRFLCHSVCSSSAKHPAPLSLSPAAAPIAGRKSFVVKHRPRHARR